MEAAFVLLVSRQGHDAVQDVGVVTVGCVGLYLRLCPGSLRAHLATNVLTDHAEAGCGNYQVRTESLTLSVRDSHEGISAFEHDPNGWCPLSQVSKEKCLRAHMHDRWSACTVAIVALEGAASSCTYPRPNAYIRIPTWAASPPFTCRR